MPLVILKSATLSEKFIFIQHRAIPFILRRISTQGNPLLQRLIELFILTHLLTINPSSAANTIKYVHADQIVESVNAFVQPHLMAFIHGEHQAYELHVGHVDNRLRLTACDNKIELKVNRPPLKMGRNSIKAACSSPKPWKLLVPVTIDVVDRVVVVSHSLAKSTTLSDAVLRYEKRSIRRIPGGYFSNKSDVIGQMLKGAVIAGKVLQTSMLKKALLVTKNQEITIENNHNKFLTIKTSGIALSEGHMDQQIQVKNTQSNRIITAKIIGKGIVEVNP